HSHTVGVAPCTEAYETSARRPDRSGLTRRRRRLLLGVVEGFRIANQGGRFFRAPRTDRQNDALINSSHHAHLPTNPNPRRAPERKGKPHGLPYPQDDPRRLTRRLQSPL